MPTGARRDAGAPPRDRERAAAAPPGTARSRHDLVFLDTGDRPAGGRRGRRGARSEGLVGERPGRAGRRSRPTCVRRRPRARRRRRSTPGGRRASRWARRRRVDGRSRCRLGRPDVVAGRRPRRSITAGRSSTPATSRPEDPTDDAAARRRTERDSALDVDLEGDSTVWLVEEGPGSPARCRRFLRRTSRPPSSTTSTDPGRMPTLDAAERRRRRAEPTRCSSQLEDDAGEEPILDDPASRGAAPARARPAGARRRRAEPRHRGAGGGARTSSRAEGRWDGALARPVADLLRPGARTRSTTTRSGWSSRTAPGSGPRCSRRTGPGRRAGPGWRGRQGARGVRPGAGARSRRTSGPRSAPRRSCESAADPPAASPAALHGAGRSAPAPAPPPSPRAHAGAAGASSWTSAP